MIILDVKTIGFYGNQPGILTLMVSLRILFHGTMAEISLRNRYVVVDSGDARNILF